MTLLSLWSDGRRYEVAAVQSRLRVMRISRCGIPPRNGCLIAAVVLGCCFEEPGEFVERRHPRPVRASTRPRCLFAAAAVAGLAAGKICDRLGAKLAASGAVIHYRRTVSGGVLGRTMAGAAVCR